MHQVVHRFLVGVVGLTALGVSAVPAALAADMAVKAPQARPVASWTGCYLGGNVGAGWHRIEQSQTGATDGTVFVPPIDWGSSQNSGFIGGAQVGCDYQLGASWVVGLQDMFDFGNVKSSNNLPDPRLAAGAPFQNTVTRNIFTTTGRLGYLFTPQLLGYVKGGGAWTRTSTTVFVTIPVFGESEFANSDRIGGTVGGGLEWRFTPNWSVFAEYNYMDFGRRSVTFTVAPGAGGFAPSIVATRLTMQTVDVGLNWRFNGIMGALNR